MATKATTTKDIETVEEVEALELLEVVDAAIKQVVKAHGIDIQKARYKAMRAIAWQAFVESIEAGDFEALTERAIANVDALPAGWELTAEAAKAKRTSKPAVKAPKAPVKKAPAKRATTATKAPAKATSSRTCKSTKASEA